MANTGETLAFETRDRKTVLTSAEVAEFHRRGFVSIPRISTVEEISRLHEIFARLFEERAGRREGGHYDMLSHDGEGDAPSLPTIINPVDYASQLRRLEYRTNALGAARQLLGPRAVPSFEQAILKPPRRGGATPWHQDEAYRYDPNFEYRQVSIWMPLQDATAENGCMRYIPESHRCEVLPHRSVGGDPRVHAIECPGGFDPRSAVVCPLPAGGATLHDGRTLHGAGPNLSDGPRYAYILSFEVPPVPARQPRQFSWNVGRRAANLHRKREWRRKGGVAVEAWRKFRRGVWKHPGQVAFEIRRALRAVFSRHRTEVGATRTDQAWP
jgi:hypothetical protein